MSAPTHEHTFVTGDSPVDLRCACGASVWTIQSSLHEAADDAKRIVGDAYTGCRVRQESETLELWLRNAPAEVVQELAATRPGVYVIHNDAPRSRTELDEILALIDFAALNEAGISIHGKGPDVDGYVSVAVLEDAPGAQAKLDEMFGLGVIRVGEEPMAIAC
jgi:hypothetical protein